MNDLELSKVKRVVEITNYRDKMNTYLGQGWVLIGTYTMGVPSDGGPSQMFYYVLGWISDEAPPPQPSN